MKIFSVTSRLRRSKFGLAYARIVPSTHQWLPGASILAVASGGAEGVSYGRGLILGAVYLAVAIAAAMAVFLRTDVAGLVSWFGDG